MTYLSARIPILCLALALLTATAVAAQSRLAITPVTVVDVIDGGLHSDQTVIVEGNRIVAIGAVDEVPVPDGAEVVDASGGYLIPGLWDMHVHAFWPGLEGYFALLVANGVTGIRDMGNATMSFAEIREVRSEVALGQRVGPRFVAAGVLVDGPNSRWSGMDGVVTAETPERGRALVDSLAAEGADFIKVYSYLQPDVYAAIIEQAERLELPVVGHVPYLVRAEDASAAGQLSFEHLIGIEDGCSADEPALIEIGREELQLLARGDTVAVDSLEREWRRRVLATQDDARCQALFDRLRENGTFQVPTLVQQRSSCADAEALTRDPRLKYVPGFVQSFWPEVRESTRGADLESERALCRLRAAQVGRLARSGVPLLAGTDAGWPWVIWGFSVHEELKLLVEAGLTPLQALKAATLIPARYLGAMDSLGTVATGKLADLVVLDGDPLEDIENTRRIRAVVADGRLYRRADLDRLLVEVEASNRKDKREK